MNHFKKVEVFRVHYVNGTIKTFDCLKDAVEESKNSEYVWKVTHSLTYENI